MTRAARFLRSLGFATRGVAYAWRTQAHWRFEVAVAVVAIAAAAALGTGLVAVVLASALVLVAELANTAVEVVVDLVAPEPDPRAAVAKDVAAGAVLVAALGAVAVGIAVFGPVLVATWRAAVG